MISRKKNYAVILITILIISDNVDTDDTVLNVTEKDNIFGTTTTIADISLNMIEVTPDDTALNVSEKDEDYDGSGQGREGKEEIDPEKLFYQFKVKNFQATALSNTTMFLKWTIQNATNPLDSGRILNISTVYEKDAVYFNDTRIVMSKDICHKHSDLLGDCNYTLAVEPCSNYLFRLGGSANECAASTISIEPFSIREDISEDHQNGTLLLSWNITCDSEFMKPVFVTLTQNIPNKKSVRKQEQLSALCKNRRCSTRSKKLLTTPCSNYSLQIDGIDEVHTLETAPKITELKADQMTLENKYFLRWSILPLTCPFDPRLMVARIENPSDLEPPQYNKLVLNASADQYCKNGKCQDMFEVEPCVTYRIKASNSNVPPIKVSGPKSVSELEKEYTGDLKNLIRLHWKACHNENIFSFITPIKEFNEKINRVSLSNITTVCDGSSRRCTSSLIVDNMMVRPCSQYKVEVGDSNETLYFETPPYDMTRQPKITFTFSKNQTLTISLLLSGFQSNCDKWNFTLELEIVDLSQEVKTLSCHNNGDLGRTKNCTISFPIDKLDFMCLSEYRIKSRLVYSRSDLTSKIYRGNWKETTIKPTKPSEWDGEALTELKMDYNILNQSLVIEWKSPLCLRGSTEFSTNLNIVSGSIESDKYIISIPPNCSKLDEIEGEISTVRKVIIDNDHIKCTDGKHILKKDTSFKLVPCTSYSIQLTPMLLQDKEELPSSSVISNFSTALIPLNGIQMSSNLTASHISGYEWQFNLNFTTKENNPCGKHINSATIQIVDAREGSQNIPCTQNMTCNGVVKLNYFNMCRPLPVTIVFQYSQTDEIKGHVSWFNKTLPPFVVNQTSGKTFNSLTINYTNRHRFEIQWQDHICLPNGSVSSSVLEIRQWNGIAPKPFNVPQNCSYTGKSKLHRVFLEENKLVCQENSTLYHIQLPPCTDYLVSLTPVVKDTNAPQVEYSQSINFTTPFNPSSIENLKTANSDYIIADDMTRQPKITFTFSKNQTLTISLLLSGFQSNCDKWNFTLELEIVDLSQEVKTLSCHNNGDLGRTKNCTISFPIDKLDFMCLSEYRIKSRLVYSRSDLTSKIYRGNWKETKIKPTKPSEWDGEALTELKMDYDIFKQTVFIEWKSPLCLRGSTEFSTNLNIVSGSIESDKYIVSIPPNCSKLDEIEGEISTVRKVIIDNDHIKCIDGKHILKKDTSFKLVPCTSYSIQLTPMLLQDKEELPSSSVISNFTTALIPLNGIQMSSNLTASHISGYEWQFNLNFTTKENNPCGKHINSATIRIVDAREGSQTIRCNQGIACNGIVKLNHFNMCRPLPVTIGFQYSQTEIKGHVSWFNKTLPPFVVNQTSGKTFNSLTINYTNRHRFEIQWQDHICLPNGSVSSSVLEIRQWNGIAPKPFNVPQNCSYTGKSKLHRVFLEENKLVCQENSTLYHIQLPPCTDYLVSLTPVVKGTNASQVEYSQSINFTTPFDPSSIENLKTASVTSSSFELQWTIPRQCSNTSEINIEVDGEKYSSLSFGFLSRPYTECDEVKCRVTWSNPTDLSLDPCTTYNIRIGPFTNETITTLPRDNGLTIFPEKTSVTTKLRDDSHLNITLTIDELDLRCSSRLIAIDFELPDVEPPIKQNLTCKLNVFDQQASSSEVVCSQEIPIIRMDKCIPYNFTFRPVYENGLFSDEVRSVRMKLNPLLSEEEKNELHVPPEVEIYGPQTIRLYWNDPVCLMTTDVLSWEIRINNTANEYDHKWKMDTSECASGSHLPVSSNSMSFKNSFQLDKDRISWCNQSAMKMGSVAFNKSSLVFMPCSRYMVSVIPVVGVSNFIALENFVEKTSFTTSIEKINPTISQVTFNTFELTWSFPVQCLLSQRNEKAMVNINKRTIQISFSNLSTECVDSTCVMKWISPRILSACTEYLVSVDLIEQKIFSLPNYLDRHWTCGSSNKTYMEFIVNTNDNEKLLTVSLILSVSLGLLGFSLIYMAVGICFGIFHRDVFWGKNSSSASTQSPWITRNESEKASNL